MLFNDITPLRALPIRVLAILVWLLVPQAVVYAQQKRVTVSGQVKDQAAQTALPFVNVVLKTSSDSAFVMGTVTNDEGRFTRASIRPDTYLLETSFVGYATRRQPLYVGSLSEFLDLAVIGLAVNTRTLGEVLVTGLQDAVGEKLDKKTFTLADNVSQTGGSVLQAMQNLPGVTVQEGKVQLRGNDKVMVLVDGQQTGLTGFGNQTGLGNIPASAIEKIEIINNPSARYDANGNAGIINIIYRQNQQEGFNGKAGFSSGLGSLWERARNLPTIRPQYRATPKVNPSLPLNYRKNKVNTFFQGDYLYTQALNKYEFLTHTYANGDIVEQQTKRNRNTGFLTLKSGVDWAIDGANTLTLSGLYGSEKIIDRGDEPFFNADLSERLRLWQFLEDELKTTVVASAAYQHKFKQAGHLLKLGFNYTFHREDEKYFFDNILPAYTGKEAFKLLSDEHVADFNFDYFKPLKYGRLEGGFKFRKRDIPTNMQFFPGLNSPLDVQAGGPATYREVIPALYGNLVFENKKWESELGMRLEYVDLQYQVNPNHNTYKSDGYQYTQPFPNVRLAFKVNDLNKISLFYNRRVDRPNEVDIRIFPKYDDAEIIKVGNPELQPQFTNLLEAGYKTSWAGGSFYSAAYHRFADKTITRIATTVPGSNLIYAIFQNIGKSYNTGLEAVWTQEVSKKYAFNLNLNGYHNRIEGFTVQNKYPVQHSFSAGRQELFSGNIKLNNTLHLPRGLEAQVSAIYLAPDLIPQGRISARFSLDLGLKKAVQHGKGEVFGNATDLLNTMVTRKDIQGADFQYLSTDYYETQVVRLGYSYKF